MFASLGSTVDRDGRRFYALVVRRLAQHVAPGRDLPRGLDLPDPEVAGDLFTSLGYARTATVPAPGLEGDLLRPLYQDLVPAPLRHERGEYYTPEWLVDHVLDLVGFDGDPTLTVLDPACGSGAFLVRAIQRVLASPAAAALSPDELARCLTTNIVGHDSNPLAALTARINFVLALGDLLPLVPADTRLPIHLTDALDPAGPTGAFDRVVGNPPWINWADLNEEDRQRSAPHWRAYGLFEHRGYRARLGGAMDDLSTLLLYLAMDRQLSPSGTLGFLITRSVFHSEGGGRGFRRLQLRPGEPLRVVRVEDLSAIQPFEGAATNTAAVVMKKDAETRYPVPYGRWLRGAGRRIQELRARPVDPTDETSPWMVATASELEAAEKCSGPSAYAGTARYGVHTHCNGAYWVDILEPGDGEQTVVRNLGRMGRPPVEIVEATVEPRHVYPLLRGRDVQPWRAEPVHHIVLAQDPRRPAHALALPDLERVGPRTLAYFRRHEQRLRRRSGFIRFFNPETDPFYSVYNVGPYTFAPYKVVWREQAATLTCAVISSHGGQTIIPDHKLNLCPFEDEDEAHYLCGFLSSGAARFMVGAYAMTTSVATHLLKYLKVPRYDAQRRDHTALSAASRQGHQAALAGDEATVARVAETINEAVAGIWRLN